MAAETETGFMIDGVLYEIPSLDSFNMDEAQVLYDYSRLIIEDFVPDDDAEPNEKGEYDLTDEQQQKMKNPGFLRALMHIAYQRGNPRMNQSKVKAVIGSVNMQELMVQLAAQTADGEDDALPPALTTEPAEASPNGSVGSSESSGDDSEKSSDGQVVQLAHITTTESDTPATPSLQAGSAH